MEINSSVHGYIHAWMICALITMAAGLNQRLEEQQIL